MVDGANSRFEALLEDLASRFDLLAESIARFDGHLQALRDEFNAEFSEVGRQVQFLSEQIGQNRSAISQIRADLSSQGVAVSHAVEQAYSGLSTAVSQDFSRELSGMLTVLTQEFRQGLADLDLRLREVAGSDNRAAARRTSRSARTTAQPGEEAAERVLGNLREELKVTNKALSSLNRKFDRFDDKVLIQVKDQDQRLRKLERRARG